MIRRFDQEIYSFQNLIQALPFPIFSLDSKNRFNFVNNAAEQFFKLGVESLSGKPLEICVPIESPMFSLVQQVREKQVSFVEYDIPIIFHGDRSYNLTLTLAPIPEKNKEIVVSFQEQSMAQRFNKQVLHLNAAKSVTGLAALLAHEVKNPLSGIRGAAQLLEEAVSKEEDIGLTRLICEETDRVCKLVDNMGLFSDAGVKRDSVNIHAILERVRTIAKAGFGRHVEFSEKYDPSLPPVYANGEHLIQIFLNIIKNACEAVGEKDGIIAIETYYEQGFSLKIPNGSSRIKLPLTVKISDNGPGISSDMSANLFDPFVTSKREGSGLGLALVAKLIGEHGGIIEFETSNLGTEFRVSLPIQHQSF